MHSFLRRRKSERGSTQLGDLDWDLLRKLSDVFVACRFPQKDLFARRGRPAPRPRRAGRSRSLQVQRTAAKERGELGMGAVACAPLLPGGSGFSGSLSSGAT